MTGPFRAPRVEGHVHAARTCAPGTRPGATVGADIVVENSYVNVTERRRAAGDSEMRRRRPVLARLSRARTAARRSTRGSASMRRDLDVCGTRSASTNTRCRGLLSGEFHSHRRATSSPFGFGGMTIDERRRLRRAVRDGDRVAALRGRRRASRRHRRSRRAAARSPAPRSSGGTRPIRSTPTAGAFRSRRSRALAFPGAPLSGIARVHRQRQRHLRRAAQRLQVPRQRSVLRRRRRRRRSPGRWRCAAPS